jgi:hypothetical protein
VNVAEFLDYTEDGQWEFEVSDADGNGKTPPRKHRAAE